MAVVAVLVMRAMGEWREIEDRASAGHAPPTQPLMNPEPAVLRSLAEDLARRAGVGALEGRRSLGVGQPVVHDTKSSPTDPVTEFDAPPNS